MNELKLTYHKAGKIKSKMEGMQSLSTTMLSNPYCQKMRLNKKTVCSKCYAVRYNTKITDSFYLWNTDLLETGDFVVPSITANVFRFNAIGELSSTNQFNSMLKIVTAHKKVTFSLWTKRVDIINEVFKDVKKPKNLILIYSSPIMNTRANILKLEHFDKVFTVFNKEYINNNNIEINCGDKKCKDCMICYSKNKIKYVNELAK